MEYKFTFWDHLLPSSKYVLAFLPFLQTGTVELGGANLHMTDLPSARMRRAGFIVS